MNAPGSVSQNASSVGGVPSLWHNSFSPKLETTIVGNQPGIVYNFFIICELIVYEIV